MGEGSMNHCIECGKPVARGRTHHTDEHAVTCLVCINARVMRTWHYTRAVARLRARARELEAGG